MNKKLAILLTSLLTIGVLSRTANAIDLSIEIGDRPYYEGPSYWDDGYLWVWVPGHFSHEHWVHGHYARRGEWSREHAHEHFRHHHHDRDHDHEGDEHEHEHGH